MLTINQIKKGKLVVIGEVEEGDFSILKDDSMIVNKNNLINSIRLIAGLKDGDLLIDGRNYNFTQEEAIEMFLLSYQFIGKVNFHMDLNVGGEFLFSKVKKKLSLISEIKKNVCGGSSEELKKYLTGMYDILGEITRKIVDRTYPRDNFKDKLVYIIDNHNFFHRTFHGMADLRDDEGRPTSVIKGLTTLIKDIISKKPDYVIFANEGTQTVNKRKEIFDGYKNGRKETEQDLKVQIQACLFLLKKMGFMIIEEEGYEADDILVSYSTAYAEAGCKVVMVSSDKDLYQALTNKNISIYDPTKGRMITEEDCFVKFGVGFSDCLMVQAIMGDSTDNVPGIKGIGQKGAAELILRYGSLEGVYENIDKIDADKKKPSKRKECLISEKENAFISLELVKMNSGLANKKIMSESIMVNEPFFKIADDLKSYKINV